MAGSILTLNAGSSSLKFALFDDDTLEPMLRGEIVTSAPSAQLVGHDRDHVPLPPRHWPNDTPFEVLLHDLLDLTTAHAGPAGLTAVGHRIVHGGPDHIGPAVISPELLVALEALTPLDPLHLPHNLEPVRVIAAARPALLQVACFDTAFHHTMPAVARAVALPAEITGTQIQRYGFHGLSYEFIARHLARTAPLLAQGRVIVAHLGSGASLCALDGGVSIATTMGFSALDGLVMATRCGHIDPGVILYLVRGRHSLADIEDMLYHRSGLLGVSGISGDMEVLLASGEPGAQAAIDLFTYRIAIEAGGLASALGGIDALVFTAGIGENSAAIRAAICDRLQWLGLALDPAANAAHAQCVHSSCSRVEIRVIATDEEAIIAQHATDIMRADATVTAHG